MAKQAAEVIAFHFGADVQTIKDCRYQPTRYVRPAVYAISDRYLCAPTISQNLPDGFEWVQIGEHYGRRIFQSTVE